MDISSLNMSEVGQGADMSVKHPGTGELTGLVLVLRSYDVPEVEEAKRSRQRDLMKAGRDVELDEAMAATRLARAKAAIVGVKGGSGNSETVEQVQALLDDAGMIWLIEQIEAFAGDRGSFFKSAEVN